MSVVATKLEKKNIAFCHQAGGFTLEKGVEVIGKTNGVKPDSTVDWCPKYQTDVLPGKTESAGRTEAGGFDISFYTSPNHRQIYCSHRKCGSLHGLQMILKCSRITTEISLGFHSNVLKDVYLCFQLAFELDCLNTLLMFFWHFILEMFWGGRVWPILLS